MKRIDNFEQLLLRFRRGECRRRVHSTRELLARVRERPDWPEPDRRKYMREYYRQNAERLRESARERAKQRRRRETTARNCLWLLNELRKS